MLIYRRTSLLESSAQTLVNTVNCVGVMGKGLARAFRDRDPGMFEAYRRICERGQLEPGKLWLWQGSKGWVLNFPTKLHWRQPSRLDWIEAGLKKFVAEYRQRDISEISFPRLGCGNGGLDWDDVRPLMEQYLLDLDIRVYVHDDAIGIELPEHLEDLSRTLLADGTEISSFEGFCSALGRLAELGAGKLTDIQTHRPFDASFGHDLGLTIRVGQTAACLETDELRALWVKLQGGLMTRARAGWSNEALGGAVLTLLALLPQARPIEIESPFGSREVAVELHDPAGDLSPTLDFDRQLELSWA